MIDEKHTHSILCDNASKYFTLYFTKDFLKSIFPFDDRSVDAYSEFFENNYFSHISFHDEYVIRVENILGRLLSEFSSQKKEYKSYVKVLLSELFLEMKRAERTSSKKPTKRDSLSVMPRVTDYIDAHCFENITLTYVASLYNFNHAYFGRVFKKINGKSFNEYIKDKRMEQIVFVLTTSNIPIDDIIGNSGYTNKSFFYKEFKKKYGCTPSEYRNKNRYIPEENGN